MKKHFLNFKSFFGLSVVLFCMGLQFSSRAAIYPFSLVYSGANEVPANASPATGTIVGTYDDVTNRIFYTINFSGLLAPAVAAHFHSPAAVGVNGPVIIHHGIPTGVTSGTVTNTHVISALQETQLFAGLWYSNIHTSMFPGGELRAQIILGAASPLIYSFNRTYSGLNEVPPNASPATGNITGTYNSITNTIFYVMNFSGLLAPAVAAHFHSPAMPGVNGPVIIHHGIPTGVTSATHVNSHVITATQETQLLSGLWYSNIHTSMFPGGEIRAQIFFGAPFVPPVLECPSYSVINAPNLCSQTILSGQSASGEPAPTVTYRIGSTPITFPRSFPVGTTIVTASAINGGGFATCTYLVVVNDLQAPTITEMNATPDILWPPDHTMRDVVVNYVATDNCPEPLSCRLTVRSSEAVNAPGSGNTSPDWIVVDDHNVKLRAERAGNGPGRIYTITATCKDRYGNKTQRSTTVLVPHDMSVAGRTANPSTEASASIRALPNPANNYFSIQVQTAGFSDQYDILLSDVNGRIVERKENLSGSQMIRVGEKLGAGIYFMSVRFANETKYLKLVKL